MNEILSMLGGGDLRSEGRAAEVAALVISDPRRLSDLAEGLTLEDRLLRARTCMAIEVISRTHSEILTPLATRLIRTAERESVPQARWHLAETFCTFTLTRARTERLVPVLLSYLTDRSRIVNCCAVLALGVVGERSARRDEIVTRIRPLAARGKSMARHVDRALERLGAT